jgi:hypothetical protein
LKILAIDAVPGFLYSHFFKRACAGHFTGAIANGCGAECMGLGRLNGFRVPFNQPWSSLLLLAVPGKQRPASGGI